jgi:hypothetical protein
VKQELDEYLVKTFPKLFIERNMDATETCMCWGFECADGWFNILNQLCQNIQHHIDWKNRESEVVPQVVVEQVKEKFGTLRFYYRGGDEYISGLVSMAEAMSGVMCEDCGAPGEPNNGGWIKTLCQVHQTEREEKYRSYAKENGLEE